MWREARRHAVMVRGLDQRAARIAVAHFRNAALLAIRAAGVLTRNRVQITHQLLRAGEAREIAKFGNEGGRVEERYAAQTHPRAHGWFPAPARHFARELRVKTFQQRARFSEAYSATPAKQTAARERHFDPRQITQVFRRPRTLSRVTKVVPKQKHLELLARPMLCAAHLVATAQQIPRRFILRLGMWMARNSPARNSRASWSASRRSVFTRSPGRRGTREGQTIALVTQPAQEASERISARPPPRNRTSMWRRDTPPGVA